MSTHKDFEAYSVGIIHASVCSSLSPEETVERANAELPTGISSKWSLSKEPAFADGQLNPCPCVDNPETHKHYLLVC